MGDPPIIQKPVLLLADSMGQCIPSTDTMIQVIVKENYTWSQMKSDVSEGRVNLQHKFVIIWAGAQSVDTLKLDKVLSDVKELVDAIFIKNSNIQICVSAVLPQPKNQHRLQEKINLINQDLKTLAASLDIKFLQADEIYMDDSKDIIRPIVDNFEDGFHLNLHGAHRLRKFWMRLLALSK